MTRRIPGIVERHARGCPAHDDRAARCRCEPAFEAWVWSPRDQRKIRQMFAGRGALAAAKGWRRDAASAVAGGKMRAPTPATVADEARGWIERAERGEVRARGGRPYKPTVLRTYRRDLERYIVPDSARSASRNYAAARYRCSLSTSSPAAASPAPGSAAS